jgi:hypothetical protein
MRHIVYCLGVAGGKSPVAHEDKIRDAGINTSAPHGGTNMSTIEHEDARPLAISLSDFLIMSR